MREAGGAAGIPPVTEVAIDLQFLPIRGLTTAHLGLFWSRLRDEFPLALDKPPLEPDIERLPGRRPSSRIALQISQLPPMRRLWLLQSDETVLIQVQQDRFIRNWRRLEVSQSYPRYSTLRRSFQNDFERFLEFLSEEGLPGPKITQCGVSYINLFPAGRGWEHHGEPHRLLTLFRDPQELSEAPGDFETMTSTLTFLLPGPDAAPAGRLYAVLTPVQRQGSDHYQLELSAKGRPESEDLEAALSFLDRGHLAIQRAFKSLCHPELLNYWHIDMTPAEAP